MKVKNCSYLRSAARPEDVPDLPQPRIAIVGRSNVGKSSLLNRLVGARALARVSRTPGRTRLVNYFLAEDRMVLVDLPGYGYARVPERMRQGWGALSEAAILAGGGAVLTALLIDSRQPPTDLDRSMADWLVSKGLSWIPVLTKFDKLKSAEKAMALRWLSEMQAPRKGIATSARTGLGIPELWKEIESAAGEPHRRRQGQWTYPS